MNKELQVFRFQQNEIRVVMIDGKPWWVAKDVCDVLEIANSRDALSRLDDDEKGVGSIYTPGGTQEMAVVNESGLYSLILGSRKPEAKVFKRWVTHEVLPTIRETGQYTAPEAIPTAINEKLFGRANSAVRNVRLIYKEADVDPQQIAILTAQIYKQIGIDIPLGNPAAPKKTNDRTAIAKSVGLFSKNGEPHAQAVGAIINKIDITKEEQTLVPYNRHGHPGQDYQYSDSVVQKVKNWLLNNNYPSSISNGTKSFHVNYVKIEASADLLN